MKQYIHTKTTVEIEINAVVPEKKALGLLKSIKRYNDSIVIKKCGNKEKRKRFLLLNKTMEKIGGTPVHEHPFFKDKGIKPLKVKTKLLTEEELINFYTSKK